MKKSYLISFFIIIIIISTFACKKQDPILPIQPELITSLNYILTSEATGDTVVFSFQDLDGEGGISPLVSENKLTPNTTYQGVLELKNESISPSINITEEVLEEALDHQFFFTISNNLDLQITYSDQDSESHPIGLSTLLKTGLSGDGILTIILRHQPNKNDPGAQSGDITAAGGETDIEVNFNLEIE